MPKDLLDRFLRPLREGPVTRAYPDRAATLPPAARGLPEVDPARCDASGVCATACPTGAIVLAPGALTVDAGRCVFCGACAEACPRGAIRLGGRIELAARTRDGLRITTATERPR